jgi:glycosyltransferase involved in cell wall biosynthesis
MPRVCFLLSTRGSVHGGLETIADHLAAGLAKRGYPVVFVVGRAIARPRRQDLPACRTLQVPVVAHNSPLARALGRVLRLPPLHVQSISFLLACLASREARRALLTAQVSVTFLEGESLLVSRLRRRASISYLAGAIDLRWARADRSTRRLATSELIAGLYRRHGLACDGVLTPGVPSGLLEGPPAGSTTGQQLLYVGRLEPNKRVEWLLPLVARLLPRYPQLTLRLVGEGPVRASLEHAISTAGLQQHVVLFGALAPEQVHAELRQADVFVFPSAYESFGTAALEALAAGLPVVASDLPALREATGGRASLVALDDLEAWQTAIADLLSDPGSRAERADAGRRWAADFTWDRIVDQFERVVAQVAC